MYNHSIPLVDNWHYYSGNDNLTPNIRESILKPFTWEQLVSNTGVERFWKEFVQSEFSAVKINYTCLCFDGYLVGIGL